jgi:hypothetical protein
VKSGQKLQLLDAKGDIKQSLFNQITDVNKASLKSVRNVEEGGVQCSNCQAIVLNGVKFCNMCGNKMMTLAVNTVTPTSPVESAQSAQPTVLSQTICILYILTRANYFRVSFHSHANFRMCRIFLVSC